MPREFVDFTADELRGVCYGAAQVQKHARAIKLERFRSQAFGRAMADYFFWVEEDAEMISRWAKNAIDNERESIAFSEYQFLLKFEKRLQSSCYIKNLMHAYSLLPGDVSSQDRFTFNKYAQNFTTNLFPLPLEN